MLILFCICFAHGNMTKKHRQKQDTLAKYRNFLYMIDLSVHITWFI